ncbi:MAG: Immunoglobulin I-set domain protein, partial [Verrucomicrobiales bacterium]|nr:Immunoglobulin I-set domain protein [Verrucomicrobiales bacterium]
YNNGLGYSYDWSVLNSSSDILTNGTIAFPSDASKTHPVVINLKGALGQPLTLHIERIAGEDPSLDDGSQNIAVDDISFAQFPPPADAAISFLAPTPNQLSAPPEILFNATIKNGTTSIATNTILLSLNGINVVPLLTQQGDLTSIMYQAPGLLLAGTNHYSLAFKDSASTPKSYSNQLEFAVANYNDLQLPPPVVFEDFNSTAEGGLPSGWSQTNYTDVSLSDSTVDFGNLDSAAYSKWSVIDVSRLQGSLEGYSDPKQILPNYNSVLSSNPSNVVNGAYIKNLATGRFALSVSGYRNGRSQVDFLYSPDFDLTGKTNLYLSYHSLYQQNQDSIGAVEYSTNQGQTWLPIVYMLAQADVLTNDVGEVDSDLTFSTSYPDVATYTDPVDGQDKGGNYGAFIGVAPELWSILAPYISPRVDDNSSESQRVEYFRLPAADNQSKVRFRFAYAGTDSWYFGIDDFGIYAIGSAALPSLTVSRAGTQVTITWSSTAVGFVLESTPALGNSAQWAPVSGVNNNSATLPLGTGNQFFRLRKP